MANMANVGFFTRVKNAITQLTKPTRGRNEGGETPGPNKRVKVYEITPGRLYSPKQIEAKRVQRDFYTLSETVSVTEDRNYEFKAGGMFLNSNHLADYINKYGSAFLNSEGGVLIGGVLDNGVVKGMTLRLSTQEWLRTMIKKSFDQFRPPVDTQYYRLKFVPVMDGRSSRGYSRPRPLMDIFVLEIHIKKGDVADIYETSDHKIFVRRDGGVQGPLRPLQIRDHVLSKYKLKLQLRQQKKRSRPAMESIPEETVNKRQKTAEVVIPQKQTKSDNIVHSPIVFDVQSSSKMPTTSKQQSNISKGFQSFKLKFNNPFASRR